MNGLPFEFMVQDTWTAGALQVAPWLHRFPCIVAIQGYWNSLCNALMIFKVIDVQNKQRYGYGLIFPYPYRVPECRLSVLPGSSSWDVQGLL